MNRESVFGIALCDRERPCEHWNSRRHLRRRGVVSVPPLLLPPAHPRPYTTPPQCPTVRPPSQPLSTAHRDMYTRSAIHDPMEHAVLFLCPSSLPILSYSLTPPPLFLFSLMKVCTHISSATFAATFSFYISSSLRRYVCSLATPRSHRRNVQPGSGCVI